MTSDLFIKICQYLGSHYEYVQGPGGNVSHKIDGDWMIIKSSGINLDEVSSASGGCSINYKQVTKALKNKNILTDSESFQFGLQVRHPSSLNSKPSMEYGFHSLLETFVLHSHSIYVNTFLCSKEGLTRLQNDYPNSLFVPYVLPGIEVATYLSDMNLECFPSIIFLDNHGLIIHNRDPEVAISLHEDLNKKLLLKYEMPTFTKSSPMWSDQAFMNENVLFPDQVIFTENDSMFNSINGIHMRRIYSYLMTQMKRLGLTPKFIKKEHADALNKMESEQYRKGKNK